MKRVKVGVVGCGNISAAYLKAAKIFPILDIVAEAKRLVEAAKAKGLRLGSAPDTFLSGAQQRARQCVDEGLIGRPVGGAAFFMCPGHERWHPSPAFYYLAGGGPMLDMGPYY